MDEVYRGYRISMTLNEDWAARITHVRGAVAPFRAAATPVEGEAVCLARARARIDEYLAFLDRSSGDENRSDR